ncbi:MAG: hypothetical protein KGL39_49570 [Patescibacteria group bacterium]|nr:hypothetical protein [Patescibacteria group bacterium]
MGKWEEDAKRAAEFHNEAMAAANIMRDVITAETLARALEEMESMPAPKHPTIVIEVKHSGVDRKNASVRSEASFRAAIREALVEAKVRSEWPHRWSDAHGGQRVVLAEIRFGYYNSRSFGSTSESIIRYELSGRFGLYDERSSGEIVDRAKFTDGNESRIYVTVKAIEVEAVKSWAERVEAGEVGNEPDYTPFGVCVCGHPHRGLVCTEGECMDFVRDPSVASPFVAGGFNDPAAQIKAPAEDAPRVQGIRDEDPSPEDVEDDDLRMAILARMMRGEHVLSGHGGDHGEPKVIPALTGLERIARRVDAWNRHPESDLERAERIHAENQKRIEHEIGRSKPGRRPKGKEPRMKLNERVEPADVLALAKVGLSCVDAIAAMAAVAKTMEAGKLSPSAALDAAKAILSEARDDEGHAPVTPAA